MLVLADTRATITAVAIGAIVPLIALMGTIFANRSKINELKLQNREQREVAHLAAAREHAESIYLPLSAALANLSDAYLVLRAKRKGETVDEESQTVDEESREQFDEAVHAFIERTSQITGDGRGAYLTVVLDRALSDFKAFLVDSLTATDEILRVVVRVPMLRPLETTTTRNGWLHSMAFVDDLFDQPKIWRFRLWTPIVRVSDVLAAPIASLKFEQRFVRDSSAIQAAIRDVTLGSPG
jgi:hypothetical protein